MNFTKVIIFKKLSVFLTIVLKFCSHSSLSICRNKNKDSVEEEDDDEEEEDYDDDDLMSVRATMQSLLIDDDSKANSRH